MINAEWVKNRCLTLDDVSEHPHFEKKAYKVRNKIFATIDFDKLSMSLKLSEIDQSVFCDLKPGKVYPANGAWGKQGWTIFEFSELKPEMVADALKLSYDNSLAKKIKLS